MIDWSPSGCKRMPFANYFGATDICETTGPILVLKTAFGSISHELPEYTAKFYLNVTDDITCQVSPCRAGAPKLPRSAGEGV